MLNVHVTFVHVYATFACTISDYIQHMAILSSTGQNHNN